MDETRRQYATNANLTRRANLHQVYGTVPWFPWLVDRMVLPSGPVLDIGCGPGWLWRNAQSRIPSGLSLTLLDTSPAMVDEATKALEPAPFAAEGLVGDAMALPFPDRTYDAVVMMHMLYHVPDVSAALAEAHRVLRPGGRVSVTTNMPANLSEITQLSAEIFGTSPYDPAAEVFSLANAEDQLAPYFTDVTRHDLTETYACDDAEILLAFLCSMPPANTGSAAQLADLKNRIDAALATGNGTLLAHKHTGLVTAAKSAV